MELNSAWQYVDGQLVSQTITQTTGTEPKYTTEQTMTYIQGGNYIKTLTDENGGVTTYTYDHNDQALIGQVTSVTDPNGNVTNYTYDPNTDELLSASGNADPSYPSATTFTMQDYLPQTINRNGTTYSYVYDNQNRVTASKVGTQTLMTTSYNSRQQISSQTHANGATYIPVYDDRDRLVEDTWKNTPTSAATTTARYFYNKNGQVSQVNDAIGVEYIYDYAFYGLLHKIRCNGYGTVTECDYDRAGNLSGLTFSIWGDIIYDAKYKLNEKGAPEDVIIDTPGIETALHYNYDGLNRLTGQSCGPIITSVSYPELESTAGSPVKTSNLVQTYVNENSSGKVLQQYGYTYDQNGNITGITEHELDPVTLATNTDLHSYAYDGLNRLASETDDTGTSVYSYDIGGNLTSVTRNGATVKSYSYGNSNWRDQLTAVDGKPITYDASGNPLTYDGYTFTWQRGRQLANFSGNGTNVTYRYDAFGNRTEQTFNGTSIYYSYSGNLLMSQESGTNTLDFQYDSKGNAVAFKYNGTPYYYMRNQQGDVVAITDAEGTLVASYSYDAWGNVTSSSGAMASINPIRYRGYYQDPVTNWYCLGTRYYSPEWRRFVNADSQFIAGDDQLSGSNMYAYCNGNPVMCVDQSGTEATTWQKIYGNTIWAVSKATSVMLLPLSWAMEPISNSLLDDVKGIDPGGNSSIAETKIARTASPLARGLSDILIPKLSTISPKFSGTYDAPTGIRHFIPINMKFGAPWAGYFLGFEKSQYKKYENYTSKGGKPMWQSDVGYSSMYDYFFSLGGPIFKEKFEFVKGSGASTIYYVIWIWKGDYWNLGTGAEIGLYYTKSPENAAKQFYEIDTSLLLQVEMTVKYRRFAFFTTTLNSFEDENWWVCSFTPQVQLPNINWIVVNLRVKFNDPTLIKPFYDTKEAKEGSEQEWSEVSWTPTPYDPSRNSGHRCNCTHPTQCKCNYPGCPGPCRYYSETGVKFSGYQFKIDY